MKRIISSILAVSMLLSICIFGSNTAFSADKAYVTDKLAQIQQISGFIPGKTSTSQGNCYDFIAKVCEKLYGVTYNGEGLYENYKVKHESGNYYTVATFKTSNKTPTQQDVENIISFFILNAMPGDVVHYGCADKSVSKTHTFMVNNISATKMEIYHSNYQIAQNPRESCHVDDLIWSNFRSNPTKHVKNSDNTLYSLNAMFYNTMKMGGVGITINRYSKYEQKYYAVSAATPNVSLSRNSTNSVKVSFTAVPGATKYIVEYKKENASSYTLATSECKELSYIVDNLTVGQKYTFRVAAYVGNRVTGYSTEATIQVLPPTLTVIKFSAEKNGLKLKWTARNDISGVRISRSESESSGFSNIKTIDDNSVSTYTDKNVSYNKTYYYKIERYVKSGSKEYSKSSKAISGKYVLSKPAVEYVNKSDSVMEFNVTPDGAYEHLEYYVTNSASEKVVPVTKTDDTKIEIKDLKVGKTYNFHCRQTTSIGSGEYATVSAKALPKAEEIKTVSVTANGIKIDYSVLKTVDGYKIYRSTKPDKDFSLIKTVENEDISSFTDSEVEYNKEYYYKVRSYVKDGSSYIYSEYSSINGPVKISLSKPEGISVTRKTPTSVTVKWKAVNNAEKYLVQYKEENAKSWTSISSVTSNSKVISKLKLGATYQYRVKAQNRFGSGSYCAKISKKTLPPTPSAPTLKLVKKGVKVSWKAKSQVTGYMIYRATSKNGKYTLVKTIANPNAVSFTDKSVQKNKNYYYKIVCYKTKSKKTYVSPKSSYSNIKNVR